MGYFPNGTSGLDYMETYCFHCVNWCDTIPASGSEGCFVMDLHSLWNDEACNGEDAPKGSEKRVKWEALEHFIPTSKDGIGCEQCRMYQPKTGFEAVVDKTQALKEWEALYGRRTD